MASVANGGIGPPEQVRRATELLEAARRSELEASRRAAEAEAILASVTEGVLVYDQGGRIIRSNAAADAFLGCGPDPRALSLAERPASSELAWLREDGTPLAPEDMPALRAAHLGETHRCVQLRLRRAGVERWCCLTAQPLVVGAAHVGALVTFSDITERKRRDANQALLAAIADDFARFSTEEEITSAVGARLAEHLDISVCTVADVARGVAIVRSAFSRAGTVAPAPPLQFSELVDQDAQAAARAGRTVVVRDTRTDVRLGAERVDALGIRAGIMVPLQRRGELRHCLSVGCPDAREWRPDEIQVVEEVASRLFPRIERARAEEAMRESEERFRILADAMPQIVCVLGLDGTAEYVNPEWTAFSGLDLQGTRKAGWEAVLHPADLGAARACRRRALKTQAAQDVELRYRASGGGYRWFLSRLAPVVDAGRVTRFVGAGMDVDDLKRAEARLRRMMELNPVGVLTADEAGRVLNANDAYLRTVGFTRADLEGGRVRWDAITPPEYRAADLSAIAQAKERGVSDVYEKEYVRPDGTRVPVLIACATMDSSGELTAFVVDISDRRRAEDALRASRERLRDANRRLLEADRRKDEFLGMLSHELRNPLAPIRNALYLLDQAEPGGQQARRAKEIARRQVDHMTRLVDDLLDVTRIARGKIDLRRTELDLVALARRTAEDYRAVVQERGLELRLVLPTEPVVVSGDETRMAQILGNLLHNALKFTPAGGQVSLVVGQQGDRAVIQVRDTGVGMDQETLDIIFEPFVQAKQTLARTEGGLGLGLALVKGLVTMHGGEVHARSSGRGTGTEFLVTLPLARCPEASPRPSADGREEQALSRRRILVVDDNHDAADTLAQLLALQGHDVAVAHDGPGALAATRASKPDVVLCDIGLPGMDGYELARRLREGGGRDIRLVALSGYAQPEDVARATEAGFDAHIAKPADPEKLRGLLG